MKKSELNPNLYLSEGNNKLKRNETSYFLIWNIPAVTTCPYRTALCEKNCYARKAEIQYKQVIPCRERNFIESKKEHFAIDMIDTIKYYTNLPKNKDKKCYFRIHEAGDFYNLDYFDNFVFIAWCFPEITFLAYTKSVDIINLYLQNGCKIPNNLVLRFSVWEDTKQEEIELAKKLDLPIYTAFPKEQIGEKVLNEKYAFCHCDCKKCKLCYYKRNTKIACAIH